MGGSNPDTATLIFADLADSPAGQALLCAILNPGALEEAVQATFVGNPQAAVTGPDEGIDAVHACPHRRPVPTVERPDLVRRNAPDLPVRQFSEADNGLRAAAVGRGERSPLLLVVASDAAIAAHPQVAILSGEQGRKAATGRRVGRRHWQWLKSDSIECLQMIPVLGGSNAEDAQTAVFQQTQRFEWPCGWSVQDRAECTTIRMKLEALLPCFEEQRSILQGKHGADSRGVVRNRGWQRILLDAVILENMKACAREEPKPASLVARQTMDEGTDLPGRGGASPSQRGGTKQPVGRRQPEGAAGLDGHVVVLAPGAFFALHHVSPALLPLG